MGRKETLMNATRRGLSAIVSKMTEDQKTEDQKRAATAALFGRQGAAILGYPVKVTWLDNNSDLGYTVGGKKNGYICIYVAWDFKSITAEMKMSEDEKSLFRAGVFAHELLHQVLTDFADTYNVCHLLPRAEASIFMMLMNLLEDPAIEHQAKKVFGGTFLKALKYSIAVIYKTSPGIEESGSAFNQLCNALVNFGDCGVVKGHFTYPEAYSYFLKVAPLYNQGIEESDASKRVQISKKVFDITRPLWEEELKDQEEMKKLLEELLKQLAAAHDPKSQGSKDEESDNSDSSDSNDDNDDENGSSDESKGSKEGSKEQKARNELLKAIKKAAEEGGQMPEDGKIPSASESDGKSSDSDSNGDESSDNSSDGNANDDGSSDSAEGGVKADGESSPSSDDCKADGESKKASTKSLSRGNSNESSQQSDDESSQSDGTDARDNGNSSSDDNDSDAASDNVDDTADDILDPSLSKKDTDELNRMIENEFKKIQKAEKDSDDDDELPDYEIQGSVLDKASSHVDIKETVKDGYAEIYKAIVSKNRNKIRRLTNSLDEIFEGDKEEIVRSYMGRYNVLRGAACTSPKFFDKRKAPGHKKDCEVLLLVDMSGSMQIGLKEQMARETAVIFGEALMALNVPHYIMGFTADDYVEEEDGQYYDVVHHHFVTWNSSKRQHQSLVGIRGIADNEDGFSIRTAKAIMDSRNASNKLIIIISDGMPASLVYNNHGADGVKETSRAIRDARKSATVLGIAIGTDAPEKDLRNMYGQDFVHIADETGLSNLLIRKLCKIIKERFK